MKVMVIGATGLTGAKVVDGLLELADVEAVITPVRRKTDRVHEKLTEHEVNFDDLEASSVLFSVDAIICCLGTTIKKAGSREQFRKVDYGYCLKAAELGRAAGADAFLLMSAIGASSSSTIFYNRVKGELEDAIGNLKYPYLSIYHPSLLLGERTEHRTAEALGMRVMPLVNLALLGPLDKYRGIEAETVARAMVNEVHGLASEPVAERVVQVREHSDIIELAG